MKFLLLTLEYPPFFGGVANFYGNLVKHWPESGSISVLDNDGNKLVSDKLPVLRWVPSVRNLYMAVKRQEVDHVIVGHILPLGIAALVVKKLTGVPYSVVLHGMDFTFALKTLRKKKLAASILANSEKIICGNSYVAGIVKNFLGDKAGNKISVINPGVGANSQASISGLEIRAKYGLEKRPVLLSVGRLVARKGFDTVIDALPEILKRFPELSYVILGNGAELGNLKSKIDSLRLNDEVRIITDVGDDEKRAWYEACDLFVMPAREIDGDFEGFGIVYLESGLAGKPVIAAKSGGVGDAVIDNVNGLMVEPDDKEGVVRAIIRLLEDKALRNKLGEKGKERAVTEFSWKTQAEKFYNLLSNR